jgi:hypothetical protein
MSEDDVALSLPIETHKDHVIKVEKAGCILYKINETWMCLYMGSKETQHILRVSHTCTQSLVIGPVLHLALLGAIACYLASSTMAHLLL